ncbi:bifunctional phosphoribosylaminoimidazolecarboxamide formyltransferase/IMP cyclohydrolase [Chlorobium phaeobacteroides]|jgi:phosphoribosylaminoimidazolecarboxamide formyltransferase/IMP cyclohydrolase|uniref:Bifunctional purine biosynthesis protein PurH n=1 Tax=Chlorobium phaeobacteroides (strain DSM 266 / SMG 266 / 2430) TaxID=290317 RepID=PUR9_CHLPD|nr:bifunctional phosphoribosylaminoimidazolecarboxamide formyltransferase/IMP cyclohydrolase [Chlorobium phaeobacteroides]A1BE85.1 RecName: Full=Bifunctional purine biosynthesis protein PurH; Includes: RecName: Full=Phosphoribosylaminoimidazolecarboxamide formyltransferase; AltName: Full=AICAR transformylase; Includes: RecName: Full=IMP cyclohydrolase; AltName: Full=ATIC; AltName: Full=IMP synthase; AltName: Full=Inosinicase [Chlorobium phaeobacteroides DSM 266]ABL64712.1 IMP cyclohydrolase [Chlo
MSDPVIKRALVSVSDKTGIVDFCRELSLLGVEVFSTGGTLKTLQDAGIAAASISTITGFPEIMDGRVKTLHPKIHGGLLAVRENPDHVNQANENGISFIDLVVVNLYPFEATVAKPDVTFEDAIENIDIGGPSMLRSAAKNNESVTVVTDSADYALVLQEMRNNNGATKRETRLALALKVFELTSRYDRAIASYLAGAQHEADSSMTVKLERELDMRYGENPHQSAGLYRLTDENGTRSFSDYFEKLHGKELSYNNMLDIAAAVSLIEEFRGEEPTVVIIKHTNPCGVAQAPTLAEAYRRAFSTDTQAPFGGIIAFNHPLDMEAATAVNEIFTEILIAPAFEDGVLEMLMKKKDRRLVRQTSALPKGGWEFKSTPFGMLVQERDSKIVTKEDLTVVTKRQPTEEEVADMMFAWKICKHIKSNTILYVKNRQTFGVGAGQMSRVDSSKIARWKASEVNLDLHGSVVASDAFFPFADGLLAAAEAGVTAVIQPGGSIRDNEVIEAADANNLAMVFTGMRHFKH